MYWTEKIKHSLGTLRDLFIVMDPVIIYIHVGSSQPPVIFKNNDCCFADHENVGHHSVIAIKMLFLVIHLSSKQ